MKISLAAENISVNLPLMDKNKLDKDGFYLLPQMLSEEVATHYEIETRDLPIRWVHTGQLKTVKYQAQRIPSESDLGRFFLSEGILHLISSALGFPLVQKPKEFLFWIHRYELRQYITEHKDRAGDIQLLLALRQPPKENGGVLFVKNGEKTVPINMQAGDAALLYATRYTHFSNELLETKDNACPSKVIAVARYYFS